MTKHKATIKELEQPGGALRKETLEQLLGDKDQLAEFTTATLLHAVTTGLQRIRQPSTPASAVNAFIETLRKVRADLTGDDHEKQDVPQMMVNIQFNNAQNPPSVDVTPAKKPLNDTDKALLEATNESEESAAVADMFAGDNE